MAKLVVFYSRADENYFGGRYCHIDVGNTEKVARKLVKMLENLDGYDEIYLGYPNYWGDLPMAVYTFLEAFDWTSKTIYPFCTHEGSGLSGTERNIARTCKGADVKAGLAICGSDVDRNKDAVLRWLKQ